MKSLFRKSMVLVIAGLCTLNLTAQEREINPKAGLSASLTSEQLDILIPIWASERFVIAPSVGFASAEDLGEEYIFGMVPRIYFKKRKLSPFLGGRFAVLIASPKDLDSTTDIVFGFGGGGEYFFDNHFSVGVEAQFNVSVSDEESGRFGNPGRTNMNTASAIFATIYF